MDKRRGSRPLVGREGKKATSERDATPATEWNGGDGIREQEPNLGKYALEGVDRQCREMTSHFAVLKEHEHTFPTTCPPPRFAPYRVAGRGGRVVPMRHEIRLCRLFRAEKKGFPPSREALASAHHLDAACTCVLWLGADCGLRRWQATDGLSRVGLPLIPARALAGRGRRKGHKLPAAGEHLTSTTSGGRSLHSTICE